eukprot:6662446-Alexandrium_andersonii.AAC.1
MLLRHAVVDRRIHPNAAVYVSRRTLGAARLLPMLVSVPRLPTGLQAESVEQVTDENPLDSQKFSVGALEEGSREE